MKTDGVPGCSFEANYTSYLFNSSALISAPRRREVDASFRKKIDFVTNVRTGAATRRHVRLLENARKVDGIISTPV